MVNLTIFNSIKNKNKKIGSIIITLGVLLFLILLGPLSAVTINLIPTGEDNGIYHYTMVIDLHENDNIPLDLIAIKLTNTEDQTTETCYFNFTTKAYDTSINPDAQLCHMITINDIVNNANYLATNGYGYGYGYGYNYTWGTHNISWSGYGYGYSYGYGYNTYTQSVGQKGEVVVTFSVDTTIYNGPDPGVNFTINAGVAGLENGGVKYIYYGTQERSFISRGRLEDNWDNGMENWQSNIVSPYIIKNQWKLINFSIYREAGEQSCLENLTIILPNSNYTYNGYNDTTAANYTFSVSGDKLIWKANTTPSTFFCGQGPVNFIINITSNDSYDFDLFQVISKSANVMDNINLTIFTTTTFSYNGTVYDNDKNPLQGAVASLTVLSFGQEGDVTLGTFSSTTDANGVFNITGVPGLNVSLEEGGKGQGGPGNEEGLFYRLTATKYNDTPTNHYAMYVGPSLPELPESDLRTESGLNNPEIYLKPAVTFHIHVGGYDYKSGPNNVNETCPGPQCSDWEPEFNWTNIGFSYGLKDKKLGFPVSSEFSSNAIERWVSAPLNRNYSLMIFPESSFPIYVDFENINSTCNSTGYNLSDTGVNATCTITNGTYLIDAVISSAMDIIPLTGKVNMTNLTNLWIVPYRVGAGNMIFDQDILPFNLRQMSRWPKNNTLYDDFYNKSSGEYSIYLPATEAPSDIMLMAFAEKNNIYYLDYFKLSSKEQNFSVSEYNFTLNKLIDGVNKTISSNNISDNWNNTPVVNTMAVKFNLVDENNTLLDTENPFVEIEMEINGTEYMRMTNSQNGAFTIPLIEGEGIKELTIFSQSYAPVSAPVSASVLNGLTNTSIIKCKNGICNITLSKFDPFDPDNPNATLGSMVDFYKSNSTCDVPNPPEGCNMVGNENRGMNKTEFSPLKAILMGDISLRITSGDISVHYVKTDLLASGPPDAAFSQNSTGSDMEAAWKFGSKGPEIYDEVLISMPYASSLQDKNLIVSIPVLYDNDFNVIWNASVNTSTQLIGTDYEDYLNNSYEAYLNGTGVECSETDENLSIGLCYKDTTNKVVWIKIPHFSGIGPQVTGVNEVNDVTPDDSSGSSNGGGSYVSPKKDKNADKNATKKLELIPGKGLINNTKLQTALEKVLGKGKMSEQARENMLRLSESITSNLEATREFKAEQNKSRLSIKIKYKGNKTVKNFIIYDKIPKTFANSSDLITVIASGATVEIVNKDPEYLFNYPEVSPDQDLEIIYEVSGEKDADLINDASVEFYAESLEESIVEDDEKQTITEEYCIKKGTGEKLSLTEAKQIAINSECGNRLTDTYVCNEDTGTWWIDLDIEKEGCNPACVVDVTTKTAEINWRCTGALSPEQPNHIWRLVAILIIALAGLGYYFGIYKKKKSGSLIHK